MVYKFAVVTVLDLAPEELVVMGTKRVLLLIAIHILQSSI